MSTPISDRQHSIGLGLLIAAALLAGCKERAGNGGAAPEVRRADTDCAIGNAAGFARACSVERAGLVLTVRHADGGFRRLLVTKDGPVAADGALPATVTSAGSNEIEVAVDGDRYRLPATIGARQ